MSLHRKKKKSTGAMKKIRVQKRDEKYTDPDSGDVIRTKKHSVGTKMKEVAKSYNQNSGDFRQVNPSRTTKPQFQPPQA